MKEQKLKPRPTPPKERFHKVTKLKTRPSTFLDGKCQVMENLLSYFDGAMGSMNKPVNEKLLVFLAQIDFWDWEIENLVYSFVNFQERSAAWTTLSTLSTYILDKFDVLVQSNIDNEVFWKRYCKGNSPEVTVPWERLEKILDKWNGLLVYCEERILAGKKASRKVSAMRNLNKYKKTKSWG